MSLFRKFFYRKPPDRLLEISDRVFVFDCCISTDVLGEDEYRTYMNGIVAQLQNHYSNAAFMFFNFKEGDNRSHLSDLLSQHDMMVMEYPQQYERCPLLPLEKIHQFLQSSDDWLSAEGQRHLLLMLCERGGWPVLAFMLAGLLLYRKLFTDEQKTLEMVYKQAPRELLYRLTSLNPQPSQLRYLQYITRINFQLDWPSSDAPLSLDCVTLRVLPLYDDGQGCRPVVRVYGNDSSSKMSNISSRLLFSSSKMKKHIPYYRQEKCALVSIDIHCRIQGDVVLECIHLEDDLVSEKMIFRIMFHTEFIQSNVLMLNRDEVDVLWDAMDILSREFRAEVLFSDAYSLPSVITTKAISEDESETKVASPVSPDEFFEAHEIFSSFIEGQDSKGKSDDHTIQVCAQVDESHNDSFVQENLEHHAFQECVMDEASHKHECLVNPTSNLLKNEKVQDDLEHHAFQECGIDEASRRHDNLVNPTSNLFKNKEVQDDLEHHTLQECGIDEASRRHDILVNPTSNLVKNEEVQCDLEHHAFQECGLDEASRRHDNLVNATSNLLKNEEVQDDLEHHTLQECGIDEASRRHDSLVNPTSNLVKNEEVQYDLEHRAFQECGLDESSCRHGSLVNPTSNLVKNEEVQYDLEHHAFQECGLDEASCRHDNLVNLTSDLLKNEKIQLDSKYVSAEVVTGPKTLSEDDGTCNISEKEDNIGGLNNHTIQISAQDNVNHHDMILKDDLKHHAFQDCVIDEASRKLSNIVDPTSNLLKDGEVQLELSHVFADVATDPKTLFENKDSCIKFEKEENKGESDDCAIQVRGEIAESHHDIILEDEHFALQGCGIDEASWRHENTLDPTGNFLRNGEVQLESRHVCHEVVTDAKIFFENDCVCNDSKKKDNEGEYDNNIIQVSTQVDERHHDIASEDDSEDHAFQEYGIDEASHIYGSMVDFAYSFLQNGDIQSKSRYVFPEVATDPKTLVESHDKCIKSGEEDDKQSEDGVSTSMKVEQEGLKQKLAGDINEQKLDADISISHKKQLVSRSRFDPVENVTIWKTKHQGQPVVKLVKTNVIPRRVPSNKGYYTKSKLFPRSRPMLALGKDSISGENDKPHTVRATSKSSTARASSSHFQDHTESLSLPDLSATEVGSFLEFPSETLLQEANKLILVEPAYPSPKSHPFSPSPKLDPPSQSLSNKQGLLLTSIPQGKKLKCPNLLPSSTLSPLSGSPTSHPMPPLPSRPRRTTSPPPSRVPSPPRLPSSPSPSPPSPMVLHHPPSATTLFPSPNTIPRRTASNKGSHMKSKLYPRSRPMSALGKDSISGENKKPQCVPAALKSKTVGRTSSSHFQKHTASLSLLDFPTAEMGSSLEVPLETLTQEADRLIPVEPTSPSPISHPPSPPPVPPPQSLSNKRPLLPTSIPQRRKLKRPILLRPLTLSHSSAGPPSPPLPQSTPRPTTLAPPHIVIGSPPPPPHTAPPSPSTNPSLMPTQMFSPPMPLLPRLSLSSPHAVMYPSQPMLQSPPPHPPSSPPPSSSSPGGTIAYFLSSSQLPQSPSSMSSPLSSENEISSSCSSTPRQCSIDASLATNAQGVPLPPLVLPSATLSSVENSSTVLPQSPPCAVYLVVSNSPTSSPLPHSLQATPFSSIPPNQGFFYFPSHFTQPLSPLSGVPPPTLPFVGGAPPTSMLSYISSMSQTPIFGTPTPPPSNNGVDISIPQSAPPKMPFPSSFQSHVSNATEIRPPPPPPPLRPPTLPHSSEIIPPPTAPVAIPSATHGVTPQPPPVLGGPPPPPLMHGAPSPRPPPDCRRAPPPPLIPGCPPPPPPPLGGAPPPPPPPMEGAPPPPPTPEGLAPNPPVPPGPPAPPGPPGGPPPPPGPRGGPPPPPGAGRGMSSSRGRATPAVRKSTLKPLHWSKVTRALKGSLWEELQKQGTTQVATEFDVKEIETLFSAAPNKDSSGAKKAAAAKPTKVQLIDLKRAYNVEIMLSKVKIPLPDMMAAALALDDTVLDADQVENLIKFAPKKEEMELLKGYTGDPEDLGKCEQFFLELMKAPRVETKLRVFLFKIQFNSQVYDFRKSLNIVKSACDEVRKSDKLKEILKKILYLGNTLNEGTARGAAVGYKLDSLSKLTDTRSTTSRMTLMHYLCRALADKNPDLLDFHKDLVSLEASTKIQLKALADEMQSISKGLEKVKQELAASAEDGPVSEIFHKTLAEFVVSAETEVTDVMNLYSHVGKDAEALTLYFGEDPARVPAEQVTATLLNFVRLFQSACEENIKLAELEKRKAQKENND